MRIQLEPINEPGGIPSFRHEDHIYQLLNLSLDIEADRVTYHLSSHFQGKCEVGAVIDLIELERNGRNST